MTGAAAIIAPATTDDVVEAMAELGQAVRSVAIVGAGSERRAVPAPVTEAILDLSGLAGIVDHQPDDLTVTVRAGTTLAELAAELDGTRQTAVLPEGVPFRTVGGIVASGTSGYRRHRFGPTRDRVIGVEVVTGYGRCVRGGGRLVKNVTGYDLPRLVTGSRGSLGAITEITLKLWPAPPAEATVRVASAVRAQESLHRPLAVLETHVGSWAYLGGAATSLDDAVAVLGGDSEAGLVWPEPIEAPVVLAVLVPPRHVAATVTAVRRWGASGWIAQHGVGVVEVGLGALDETALSSMRSEIADLGGVIVVQRWPGTSLSDRFGYRAATGGVEDRLRTLFDPHGILSAASQWVSA